MPCYCLAFKVTSTYKRTLESSLEKIPVFLWHSRHSNSSRSIPHFPCPLRRGTSHIHNQWSEHPTNPDTLNWIHMSPIIRTLCLSTCVDHQYQCDQWMFWNHILRFQVQNNDCLAIFILLLFLNCTCNTVHAFFEFDICARIAEFVQERHNCSYKSNSNPKYYGCTPCLCNWEWQS